MNFHIRTKKRSILAFYHKDRFGWIRIFGRGIHWKDTSIHVTLFSERYGYTKILRIGKFIFSKL